MFLKLHNQGSWMRRGILLVGVIPAITLCAAAQEYKQEALEAAIQKGTSFLFSEQNEDGSWGGVRKTKGLNIFAPIPGAHDAFKMATTSLALCGLVAHEKQHPEVTSAIEKGEKWLFQHHKEVKRATGDALYNIWAHAYGIRAFTALSQRSENKQRYSEAVNWEYAQLLKYEVLGGGWSYYNFGTEYGGLYTKQPSGSNFSFVTATVLSAVRDCAESLPLKIEEKRENQTYKSLLRQRLPDGSYLYGEYMRARPRYDANRPAGSLCRTPSALNALLRKDPDSVPPAEVEEWIMRFLSRHGFLRNAKKRPVPHESPFSISGYYYYYGHFYVSELCEFLSLEKQKQCIPALIKILLEAQEKNGAWWDYPLYDYHEPYGTGYVLQALSNYQLLTESLK